MLEFNSLLLMFSQCCHSVNTPIKSYRKTPHLHQTAAYKQCVMEVIMLYAPDTEREREREAGITHGLFRCSVNVTDDLRLTLGLSLSFNTDLTSS